MLHLTLFYSMKIESSNSMCLPKVGFSNFHFQEKENPKSKKFVSGTYQIKKNNL